MIWLPPAAPMIGILSGTLLVFPVRFLNERARRHGIHRAFRQYLAPEMVERILRDPSQLHLGGEVRELTVLFCDMRGFTAFSERMADRPEELVRILNRLLTVLTEPILKHGGTVDKYMGDAVMAFWNAPLDDDDQEYNRQLTWEALMRLPLETLEARAEDTSGELRGWLELALLYRDPQANIDSQVQRLSRWREDWPDHPAARQLPETVRALQRAARERPQRVAVLLPESGPLAPAAEAIRDGMMTGYYSAEEAGNPTPDLRFYDVSDADVRSVFQQAVDDGAQFVVGPLAKDNVAELARMGTPPVTVLALNYLDQDSEDAPIFQFGLAPEDEARQIARQSLEAGDRLAGVLYPRSAWGQRVAEAFVAAWQDGGGRIVVESSFTDDTIGETVESLLDTARAEKDLRRDPSFSDLDSERPEEWPQSLDFLFLVADPNEGRQIKPALNFHYARDLPVFATSHLYNGTPAPRRDQDLDGVYFLDMPWILYEGTKLHRMAEETWPDGHGRYARLFAMGVDAYRLQARLYLLRNLQDSTLPGVTGTLRLDGARLVRESDWAVFRNGEAIPVPRVGEGRVDSTQY